MSRIPSVEILLNMSAYDRFTMLGICYKEITTEREQILSGYIMPWGKTTRRHLLDSNRKRLKRITRLCDEFGMT